MSANIMTAGELIRYLQRFPPNQRVVLNSMTYEDRSECDVDGPYPPFEVVGHEIRSGWHVADQENERCYADCFGTDPDYHENLIVLSDVNFRPSDLIDEVWEEECGEVLGEWDRIPAGCLLLEGHEGRHYNGYEWGRNPESP